MEKNTIQTWNYEKYFLLLEYDMKPVFAPPLIGICDIYLMAQFLYTTHSSRKRLNRNTRQNRRGELKSDFKYNKMLWLL